jgi:hypothetical protein
MPTEKHYVVEQLEDGQYAVRAIGSNPTDNTLRTQNDQPELATADRKPATAEQSAKTIQSSRAR